jgi:hypothetical protein
MIGGDWAGGRPNMSALNNPSARLENYLIPTATTVTVDANSTINASAIDRGNGGKVILWSEQMTTFAGTILARGGSLGGDGGFCRDVGASAARVHGQCGHPRAARHGWHAAARSGGLLHQPGFRRPRATVRGFSHHENRARGAAREQQCRYRY